MVTDDEIMVSFGVEVLIWMQIGFWKLFQSFVLLGVEEVEVDLIQSVCKVASK
jgi:hypothetical protein